MHVSPIRLGVNIDHVATLREARKTAYPSPLEAAKEAVRAGAHQITVHLREDRRHIQDRDVIALKRALLVPLNLEMAATSEMAVFAGKIRPASVTLVPEKRRELTTEGGLDLLKGSRRIKTMTALLRGVGVETSAFIEATRAQVEVAAEMGFDRVEFHTGHFCEQFDGGRSSGRLLERIGAMARLAEGFGLGVCAGHGLHEGNLAPLLQIAEIREYNIGHSIVSQAVLVGFYEAVRRILKKIEGASC